MNALARIPNTRAERIPGAATIVYKNHREEVTTLRIRPDALFFGTSAHHPEPQWLLKAFNLERQVMRTYSMARILKWVE